MSEYRFHLQKYKLGNRYACPQCGRKRCFATYIDEEGQIYHSLKLAFRKCPFKSYLS